VSFFVRDMTKSTVNLLNFVTDALETVVFEQLEQIQGRKFPVGAIPGFCLKNMI
jgi:hypothetical protein